MKPKQYIRRLMAFALALVLCASLSVFALAEGSTVTGETDNIGAILSQMTTQQKLTQLMMPSFKSYCSTDAMWYQVAPESLVTITDLPSEIADFLAEYGFGGALLNGDTCKDSVQAARLVDQLQAANARSGNVGQLLMGLDQEGGVICRLYNATKSPGNMALAATGNPDDARMMGELLGKELTYESDVWLSFSVSGRYSAILELSTSPSSMFSPALTSE